MLLMASLLVSTSLGQAIDSRDRALANAQAGAKKLSQAMQALRTSEERLSTVFEAAKNVAFIMTNVQGMNTRIQEFSPGAQKIFGYTRDEIIGQRMAVLHLTNDVANFPQMYDPYQTAPAEYNLETTLVRKSGGWFPAFCTTYPLLDEQNQPSARLTVVVDLSELKKSQERERSLSRGLNAILQSTNELLSCPDLDTLCKTSVEIGRVRLGLERCAIFLLDPADNILVGTYGTDLNRQTTDEHQARVEIGDNFEIIAMEGPLWRIQNNECSHWEDKILLYTDHHWFAATTIRSATCPVGVFFNDTAISHLPPNEAQQETVAVYCSLLASLIEQKQAETERKKLIDELEAKNAELERFTYTVSHDLKAPLITIQGFLGYLEKDAQQGNTDRLRLDMKRISDATARMQNLLKDLLELSRIGRIANPPMASPFGEIVQEALHNLQGRLNDRRAHVQVVVQEDLPCVYGDSARLVEVVQNLVDNAVKFMKEQQQPQIEIGYQGIDPHGLHVFFVRDNGSGIHPQFHSRVFGLFEKLDPQSDGTGIGLALVRRIVEVHGGRIWVESQGEGAGSTFYFSLPQPKGNSLSEGDPAQR
jgi:PAS domain S-box-containing protein